MTLTKAQKVRLGAFIAGGVLLLAGSIAFVIGLSLFDDQDLYTVQYHANVTGLENGSAVRYQGLRVGAVTDMKVSPDDPSAIEITLALWPGTILHEGTEAVMELSGITGLKTVNLVPGDPRQPILKPGSQIPAGSSFVQRISGDAEAIAEKVERIAENLIGFVSPANQRRVEDLLDSLNSLAKNADATITELREPARTALEKVEETGDAVTGVSNQARILLARARPDIVAAIKSLRTSLDRTASLLSSVDEQKVQSSVESVERILSRFDQELARVQLGEAFRNAEEALGRMTDVLDEVDLIVRAGRQDIVLSLKAVRETTEELREFSRMIAQDPSLLLRGTDQTE